MKKNVGKTDQIVRIVLAVVIFVLGIIFKSWWGLLGLVPLITGLVQYCPVFTLLKISTLKKK